MNVFTALQHLVFAGFDSTFYTVSIPLYLPSPIIIVPFRSTLNGGQWLRFLLLAVLRTHRQHSPMSIPGGNPYLPLRELELKLATAFSFEAGLVFKGPADDAGGDRKVSVVTVDPSVIHFQPIRADLCVRDAGGFPGGDHGELSVVVE